MQDFFRLTPETTIAVLGGSGFLGKYLVQHLAQRGVRVRVITRHIQDARPLAAMGKVGQVVYVQGNLANPDVLESLLNGCDAAINLIGILYEKGPATFDKIHKELPYHLAVWAQRLKLSRLVHVSALGADKTSKSHYARSKAQGEAEIHQIFAPATIIRPSVMFGPEDNFFNRFAAMASILPFVPLVGGSTLFQPVYVDDVAQAIIQALIKNQASGSVYELGGPRILSLKQVIESILRWVHRTNKVIVELPSVLAYLSGAIGQWLPRPPLTLDQLYLLKEDNIVSKKALGFKALELTPKDMAAVVPSYIKRFDPSF